MRLRHRVSLAQRQAIRGGPEKFLGEKVAKLFGNHEVHDLSSGDLPICIDGNRFIMIDDAVKDISPGMLAYKHKEYRGAQIEIARFLSGERDPEEAESRAHPVAGISTAMQYILRNMAYALGYDEDEPGSRPPYFILCPPVHPNWIAGIVKEFGYGVIRTIKRDSDGNPDLDHAAQVIGNIPGHFVVISTPDENPSGVCTPNSSYTQERKGLLHLIRYGTSKWGMFINDAIYADFSRGEYAGKRHELIECAKDIGVRMEAMHSGSKAYDKPGLRIGGIQYVGPMDDIGEEFCGLMSDDSDFAIKNGISSVSLKAIQVMYGNADYKPAFVGSDAVELEKSKLVREVFERVDENHALVLSRGLKHAFPGVTQITTAFYGLYDLTGFRGSDPENLPWSHEGFIQMLIDATENRLAKTPKSKEYLQWKRYRAFASEFGTSRSRALAKQLTMHGIIILPHDPFYPTFLDNGLIKNPDVPKGPVIRLILAHPKEVVKKALDILEQVWDKSTEAFKDGTYRSMYDE